MILLLFLLGLEYTAEELSANLRRYRRAGVLDAVLNFLPGLAFGLLLGWDPVAAILLGGVTWVSSSGIVAKALTDLGRVASRETPVVLSVLVMEDLAMAFFLPLVASLLIGGGILAGVGSAAIAVTAATAALVGAVRFGESLGRVVSHHSEEVVLLSALGLVLVAAGVAEELQVSAAVGAFLLGIALSGEVARQTQTLLSPIRDVNAALFFLFFALQIDASRLPGVAAGVLVLSVVTAATKIVTGWRAVAPAGIDDVGRARAGAALIARGEMSIVIAGLGVGAGIEPDLAPLAAGYVLLMAIAGPVLMRYPGIVLRVMPGASVAARSPRPAAELPARSSCGADGLGRLRAGVGLVGVAPADDELVVSGLEHDDRAVDDLPGQQRACDAGLDLALDEPPQRPRTVHRVVAPARDQLARLIGELERDTALAQAPVDVGDLEVDDPLDLRQRQRLEQHRLVDAVEELRTEVAAQLRHDLVARVVGDVPAGVDAVEQEVRAEVRGHDDHGVAEVDRAPLPVGQPPVVEHLQQRVEDVGVGLLDLVEQHAP